MGKTRGGLDDGDSDSEAGGPTRPVRRQARTERQDALRLFQLPTSDGCRRSSTLLPTQRDRTQRRIRRRPPVPTDADEPSASDEVTATRSAVRDHRATTWSWLARR